MRFMTTWRGPADDELVYFDQSVLDIFERHIQSDSGTEAGGILLGHVRVKSLRQASRHLKIAGYAISSSA